MGVVAYFVVAGEVGFVGLLRHFLVLMEDGRVGCVLQVVGSV